MHETERDLPSPNPSPRNAGTHTPEEHTAECVEVLIYRACPKGPRLARVSLARKKAPDALAFSMALHKVLYNAEVLFKACITSDGSPRLLALVKHLRHPMTCNDSFNIQRHPSTFNNIQRLLRSIAISSFHQYTRFLPASLLATWRYLTLVSRIC